MVDYRNHRRFTLKCIMASITPLSCKLKNPLKTRKSYDIIHKAEKQLFMKEIRKINNTLDMFKKNRSQYYSHLRNMINQQEQHDQDIEKCIQFIHKIKDHRHNKIKAKCIDKFKCLDFKRFGYHFNFTRNTQNFYNIDHNRTLSGQQNVPSSISMTTSNASSHSTAPATPMASTLSASSNPAPAAPTTAPGHPPSISSHTCKIDDLTKKWVINSSKPPSLQISYLFYRKVPTSPYHPSTLHGSLHNSSGRGFLQTSIHGSR